jgi:YVTN family beta-propeller protein
MIRAAMRRNTSVLAGVVLLVSAVANAQTSGPALIVLNKDEAALVLVDPQTKKVVGRVPTGESPHEVAVSSDGKLAFVANYGAQTPGQTISIIDLAALKELRRLDLGALRRPHGIFFAGDGKVYFTAETNRLIARYDPTAGQIDWLMGTGQVGTHMVLVNKDQTRIATANIGSDSITIMERGGNPLGWNQTVVAVGKGPEAIDFSPDDREIWTAHSRDGGVSIIDVAAKKVTQTLDLHTKRSNRLKFTPDGKLVLVSDLDAGELVVLDAPARKEIKRVKLGKNPEGILVAPDGAHAYIAVNGDNFISIVDLKTLSEAGRIEPGAGPDGMAWKAR